MEEIKIGEYIRLDDGIIGIVKYIDTQNIGIITNNDEIEVSSGVVSNSSNIIDLIEVGDYVNGSRVVEIISEEKAVVVESQERIYLYTINEEDIKSICTREQFKNIEYKVEE